MLLATYLKIAIFALATAPVGFARPRAPGSSRANTDLGARDEQFDIREFAINDIYGRDPADDYVSARELNEGVQDLELRQWAAIGTWTPASHSIQYSIFSIFCSQNWAEDGPESALKQQQPQQKKWYGA